MGKNITWKLVMIIILGLLAAYIVYPPDKKLKPGLDLAGGTSLIYEIDTQGLEEKDKKGLSSNMITILRRRIDPANIQNLVWRPQGNNRFEIQMPLASAEARIKRQDFEKALTELLDENINPAVIMRSVQKQSEQRTKDFQALAANDPNRLQILEDLAAAHDKYKELRTKSDELFSKLQSTEDKITSAELDLEKIKLNVINWSKLEQQQLNLALKEFLGTDKNIDILTGYVNTFAQWAKVSEEMTQPDIGVYAKYREAKRQIGKFNLSEDQLDAAMGLPAKSLKRRRAIEKLKLDFADREKLIDNLIVASDEYHPFKGRLDDPRDLQRMLKGAGILEFRILPTADRTELTTGEIEAYVENLKEKGPKYASDINYRWYIIENFEQWRVSVSNSVFAAFGDKSYVLASNKKDEAMAYSPEKEWSLTSARPAQDREGRRAISFTLDDKGGLAFGRVTGKNRDRPLCILLDGMAISAPNINDRITTQGIITGTFTKTEVDDMVNKLNAGSLPAMLIEPPISIKTIGPSIGVENRDKGIKAGLIGFVVVAGCMVVYYMLAGSLAAIALFLNLLFILAIMVFVSATFTLPGIAGLILTIGMSVDANVLIFERIREEQQKGSSLRIAIQNGYQKAFRTIIDANITTFITAAILYWVASEEIKGFAIVLMLGIASSMFTALFVTRVIFDLLLAKRIIKDHLFMLRLIHKPNINWMALRPIFLTISTLLIIAGLFVFFTRDDIKNNKYDIEFTGGTSVLINLKDGVDLSRQQVEDSIREAGVNANSPALAAANVYSVGKSNKQYEINTTETNKITTTITFSPANQQTIDSINAALGNKLSTLVITQSKGDAFIISTSQPNKSIVKNVLLTAFDGAEVTEPKVNEVVNDAILSAFADELEIQQNLQPTIAAKERITEELIESFPELTDFLGGIKITCNFRRQAPAADIDSRFKDLRFKPDMRDLTWYSFKLLDTELKEMEPTQLINSFVYLSTEPEAGFRQLSEEELKQFTDNETRKIIAALSLATSLPRVTQINPSIGAESKTAALIAIVLSLCAIIGYVWVRFGDVRYGIAAIAALIHDVCITLGAVTFCTYIASTQFGSALLIGDFKINLAMIAAFLTLIGYSLNDTIVIFDRIRENRRKAKLSSQIINNSINQTISRTVLTSFTTFIVVLIMYIFGGQALRGFTFAIGFGIIVGTYSSIAIAAPILLFGANKKQQ